MSAADAALPSVLGSVRRAHSFGEAEYGLVAKRWRIEREVPRNNPIEHTHTLPHANQPHPPNGHARADHDFPNPSPLDLLTNTTLRVSASHPKLPVRARLRVLSANNAAPGVAGMVTVAVTGASAKVRYRPAAPAITTRNSSRSGPSFGAGGRRSF